MALKPWWQVITPHRDIREGTLDEAVFAADLGDVSMGRAPEDYNDPVIFYRKTFFTRGIENLLRMVSRRLSEGKGDSVIQLQTPFGGGKTHSMVAVYHLLQNRNTVKPYLPSDVILPPTDSKVCVIPGNHLNPGEGRKVKGNLIINTLWGEIAYQLGGEEAYKLVARNDERRVAPGKDTLREILGKYEPLAILIDELLQYIVGAAGVKVEKVTLAGQTLTFLQQLTETISSLKKSILLISLPASTTMEGYEEEMAEVALTRISKITGRVERIYAPVEGEEVYEVIRKRLFEDTLPLAKIKEISQSYFETYLKFKSDLPHKVMDVSYRERMQKSYPFHPELIDTLYEKWGSFTTFQRTRGVLRLLALIIRDIYQKREPISIIRNSDINLSNSEIRREFLKHIGNQFEAVIASDIAGKNAKSEQIDRELGTEYQKYRIASRTSTAIFIHSFSAGKEKRGTSLSEIKLSLMGEETQPAIITEAVNKLRQNLWFMYEESGRYYFLSQPNLNRVLIDKRETVSQETIISYLSNVLKEFAGKEWKIYLWPRSSQDIPDTKELKLIFLSPNQAKGNGETINFINDIIDRVGKPFRVYKNTLIFSAMGEEALRKTTEHIKEKLALKELEKDFSFLKTLSDVQKKDLEGKIRDTEKVLREDLSGLYRYVYLPGEEAIDLGIPPYGEKRTISERIMERLISEEKILKSLTPRLIARRYLREHYLDTLNLWENFLKTPGMTILFNREVLAEAIKSGVREGVFGLGERENGKITCNYFKEEVREVEFSEGEVLIKPEICEQMRQVEYQPVTEREEAVIKDGASPLEGEKGIKPAPKGPRRIKLRFKVPAGRMSEVIKGLVTPLRNVGAHCEIIMEITGESEDGIPQNIITINIEETLSQIQADILEKEYE